MDVRSLEMTWHAPAGTTSDSSTVLENMSFAGPDRSEIRPAAIPDVFRETGLPDQGYVQVSDPRAKDREISPKEELLALLKLGAEVEHALLVQYLYAMMSLDPSGSSETVVLRDSIRTIALQEMAHFLTVQNLLILVGGTDDIHIGRDLIRPWARNNPLPFALEPVSPLTLKEYILVEAPAKVGDAALAARLEGWKQEVYKQAGIHPHRVGAFYTQIYWLLQPTDAPTGKLKLTPDGMGRIAGRHLKPEDFLDPAQSSKYLGQFAEWKGNNGPEMIIRPQPPLDPATPKDKLAGLALDMVYEVMEQGEGVAPGEDTHFEGFVKALDLLTNGGIGMIPLPSTPYSDVRPIEPRTVTALARDYTRNWARLFDARYTMLMLDIGSALSTDRADRDRATLVPYAFSNMRPFLLRLLGQLSSATLRALEPCGPTFGLLEQEVPSDPAARWKLYRSLLDREAEAIAALERSPELAPDTAGTSLLAAIKANSAVRSAFVNSKLAPMTHQ